ncbi:MAG: hypothetical protein DMF86_12610 [Acidobacteria bacterium]|nr:MAG: hypothetical protein DMF86_12610 [Acidobacteriota bacterium]
MDHRVEITIRSMTERMAEPLRMPGLADDVRLSPSRLSHLFIRETGVSPVRYLRMVRLGRAARLLDETVLSVKEVMVVVGCTDPSHFSRDFRRLHGAGPRAYRRRCRGPGRQTASAA